MILRPDDPNAPKFWTNESSGVLQPVVKKYLTGAQLDAAEIKTMRAYLFQWVMSPAWAPSGELEVLRLRAAAIETTHDVARTIHAAVNLGLDPL